MLSVAQVLGTKFRDGHTGTERSVDDRDQDVAYHDTLAGLLNESSTKSAIRVAFSPVDAAKTP